MKKFAASRPYQVISAALLTGLLVSVASGLGILAAVGIFFGGLTGFACLGIKRLASITSTRPSQDDGRCP
jgi:hypothetical protein